MREPVERVPSQALSEFLIYGIVSKKKRLFEATDLDFFTLQWMIKALWN
jgi:hypothetical protein